MSLINLSLSIESEISYSMYFCPPDDASLNGVSLHDVSLPCTVKKVIDFPVPSQDVTYQALPGRV